MRVLSGARETALRPPRNRPDPRAVSWWTVRWLSFMLPLGGGAVAAFWFLTDRPPGLGVAAAAFTAGCAVFALTAPHAQHRVQRWEVTGEAVYTRRGLLTHTWRVAPMSRVQTVDTARGPLQRLFGLADVTVTTASAAGAVKIEGLDEKLASDLAARLTAVTQATRGDAT